MSDAEITATTRRPEPPRSDFAFFIDFKKSEGSASRIFSATNEFIKACERLDRDLLTSIDANIEPIMVLEDVQAGSLKVYLRNVLSAIDDQALKDVDWKAAVGKYLVRAKYVVLRWLNNDDGSQNLLELRREIRDLAAETDVRNIPDYTPINSAALIRAAKDFDHVKDYLIAGDAASMIVSDDEQAEFNVSSRIDIETIEDLAIRETQIHTVPTLVLIVKKPDYLGASMWEFRYGSRTISAKIEDEDWLSRFQNRDVDVRPSDALRCAARIEVSYGHDNELLAEKYFVSHVLDVVENQYRQDEIEI